MKPAGGMVLSMAYTGTDSTLTNGTVVVHASAHHRRALPGWIKLSSFATVPRAAR